MKLKTATITTSLVSAVLLLAGPWCGAAQAATSTTTPTASWICVIFPKMCK